MASRSPYPEPLDAALAALGALSAQSADDKNDIEQVILGIVRIRSRRTAPAQSRTRREMREAKEARASKDRPTVVLPPEQSPFYGLGLREAAPKQLRIAGTPQLPREIWAALEATGYQTAHGDPPSAVRSALKRRASTHHDVFLVGEGKWAIKDWYTEEQLAELMKSIGGMGGRDKAAHSERTKAGMIVAMKRGAKPGQPTKLPPDKEAEVERMLRDGASVIVIAAHIGVAPGTIYNRFGVERIKAIRESAKGEAEQSESRGLRVVK